MPKKRFNNTPDHPRHPPLQLKLGIIYRCFEPCKNVRSVSEETGYSRSSICIWRKKYILREADALMNYDDPRGELPEGRQSSSKEIELLKSQMQDMQLETDILKETLDVLEKTPGIDMTTFRNREKAVIIGVLKNKYPLPVLLQKLNLSGSSYYHQRRQLTSSDKHAALRIHISELFSENMGRYGYRRIHALLAKEGIRISEKIVRRIMAECGSKVKFKRKIKYNSYKGEITPAVPNITFRDFHGDAPNQKWLTDVTEFIIPAGKYIYPLSWTALTACFLHGRSAPHRMQCW